MKATFAHAVRMKIVVGRDWIARVDAWRAGQADLPNRSEAIRRLVLLALDQAAAAEKAAAGGEE